MAAERKTVIQYTCDVPGCSYSDRDDEISPIRPWYAIEIKSAIIDKNGRVTAVNEGEMIVCHWHRWEAAMRADNMLVEVLKKRQADWKAEQEAQKDALDKQMIADGYSIDEVNNAI